MFNVGPAEVLMILVVALLVLGPKKLPDAARQMGKAMTEFRRVTAGLQNEVQGVLNDHMADPPVVEGEPIYPPLPEPAVEEEPTPVPPASSELGNGDGMSPSSPS